MDTFLGESIQYWIDLKQRVDKERLAPDLREISELRAKVSFYESRIQDMNRFLQATKEIK